MNTRRLINNILVAIDEDNVDFECSIKIQYVITDRQWINVSRYHATSLESNMSLKIKVYHSIFLIVIQKLQEH